MVIFLQYFLHFQLSILRWGNDLNMNEIDVEWSLMDINFFTPHHTVHDQAGLIFLC